MLEKTRDFQNLRKRGKRGLACVLGFFVTIMHFAEYGRAHIFGIKPQHVVVPNRYWMLRCIGSMWRWRRGGKIIFKNFPRFLSH